MRVPGQVTQEAAAKMHRDSIVIDACTPIVRSQAFFDRICNAGVTAATVSLSGIQRNADFLRTLEDISFHYNLVRLEPKRATIARSVEDIRRAKADGRLAIIFALQNPAPLEDDYLMRLSIFHRLGLQILQLTYNEQTLLGAGCFERNDQGLSEYGRQVVRHANRLGIVIDLSHTGIKTALDAIELSNDPCIFSHANAKALADSRRNKTDEQIQRLAEKDGVICVTPFGPCCQADRTRRPTMRDFLDHLNYIVELVGVNHVGIGSDISEHWGVAWGCGTPLRYPELVGNLTWDTLFVEGFDSVKYFPQVTEALAAEGYGAEDIQKIMGQNCLRLFERVWKPAWPE